MTEIAVPPYLLASTSDPVKHHKYNNANVLELIKKVGADGIQYWVDPQRFTAGIEDAGVLFDRAQELEIDTSNITHLPGVLTCEGLEAEEMHESLRIVPDLVKAIPTIGKVAIVHDGPDTSDSLDAIVTKTDRILRGLHDPDVVFGLEHYHSTALNNGQLSGQIYRYLDLVTQLHEKGLAIPVIDVRRLFADGLFDHNYKLLEEMCQTFTGQSIIVHARDCQTPYTAANYPAQVARLGTGVLTPHYQIFGALARENNISLVALVDESSGLQVSNPGEIADVQALFVE